MEKKSKIVKTMYFFLDFGSSIIINCTAHPAQNKRHSEMELRHYYQLFTYAISYSQMMCVQAMRAL